ncbi:PTS sugar transporter subunit IIC [Enterococcus termitis]|uniref:Permease IIC component n=1 Tax=Enterococcus termitis TaxID=332950 RepID=A0A1E5G8W1_9ENTE|nr:PTS transporter subunit EIIC [Enterococcus termitis]OEG09119.1 PTS cellbiose transporter subunit IIC [Enterococcus termitis]OJG98576.1 PTS system, lactose/cellobiose family IIC component [Enterococcus termitis]
MEKMTSWVESSLVPKVSKITNLRYFQALRNGFFAIIPLTIIGSIFMLITDFPVPGYEEFMAGIFGSEWMNFISPAYRATFNMMGIIFAGTMSYKLAESYSMDKLTSLVLGIVAYVVVLPKSVTTETGEVVNKVLSFDWLGTQGVITAIIMSIISVELTRFCLKKKLIIRMPESVPTMVSQAFSALIPGIFIVAVSLVINGVGVVFSESFPQLIYTLIQAPLQGIIGTPFAIVLVAGLNGLLWWFGIHPTVINSMLYPILYANADKNQALAELGQLTTQTGNFGTVQMLDQFATIGGAGCTIGLAIAMAIVARSSRMKAMSKISFVPAFFNINEPLIFGLPVIFNPLILIPITIAPIVSVLIALLSMKVGFMPMFTSIQAPWATPFIFSGFLVGQWQGAVTQIIAVIASVAIYYPFVKALDNQYKKEELHEIPDTL